MKKIVIKICLLCIIAALLMSGCGSGLNKKVYQFTDWNNDGKKQQILLDYTGEKEPEYIEGQEEILPPHFIVLK